MRNVDPTRCFLFVSIALGLMAVATGCGSPGQTTSSSPPHPVGDVPMPMKTVKAFAADPPKPDLPVEVTFRRSVGGGSLVAQYKNTSDRYLAVVLKLHNPTLNKSMDVTLTLGPQMTKEHGWAEGWSYFSGEKIRIHHADYKMLTVTVP